MVKKTKPLKVAKSVKNYVQKVVRKEGEIKEAQFEIGSNILMDTVKSWNLMYQASLSQGTASNKAIGDKIRIRYIKFRGAILNDVSTNKGATFGVRIGLLKHRHYYTLTSLDNSEIFKFGNSDAVYNTPDPKRCRSMSETLVLHNPAYAPSAGQYVTRPFAFQKSMNYIFSFKDLSSTYEGKLENLYLYATGINTGAGVGNNASGLVGEVIIGYQDE